MQRANVWATAIVMAMFLVFTPPTVGQAEVPYDPAVQEHDAAAAVKSRPAGESPASSEEPAPEPDTATEGRTESPDAAPPAHATDAPPLRHRVKLTDGALFIGKLEAGQLIVDTAYGELVVPAGDIVGLRPGLDHRPAQRRRIARLIRDLGAAEYKVRQDALDALIRMGPAVRPFLAEHKDDRDEERKKLVEQIFSQFDRLAEDQPRDEQPVLIADDRVETRRFTIVGKLQVNRLTIKTDYADLTLPLARIESIEQFDPHKPQILTKRLDVRGDHKATINHKRTGLRLRRGDRVTIKASGKIHMTPWGSNAFSIPDGMPNYGTYQNNIHNGALVGRVGGSGPVFKVGSDHSFTAERSGELELAVAINHSYVNRNFPGEYKVSVRVDRADD